MRKKSTYKQPTAFLLVILLGMSVLVYQTKQTYVQVVKIEQAKTANDSNEESPDSHEVFIVSQDVILSISSIQLDQEFYQIKEILFGDDESVETEPNVVERSPSYFRTLFRQVISPNAP